MNLTRTLRSAAVASTVVLASLISTSAAHAFSFTLSPGQNSPFASATPINLSPAPTYPTISGGALVTGNLSNQYKEPGTDSGAPIGSTYLTVGGSAGGPAEIDFGTQLIDYFGLYWGSIDTHNTIKFFNGIAEIASYTGADIAAAISPTPALSGSSYNVDQYVNFFADDDIELFNRVEFSTLGNRAAFESGNFAYKVPTPALLPGLIGMGVAALRRKKDETAEENA